MTGQAKAVLAAEWNQWVKDGHVVLTYPERIDELFGDKAVRDTYEWQSLLAHLDEVLLEVGEWLRRGRRLLTALDRVGLATASSQGTARWIEEKEKILTMAREMMDLRYKSLQDGGQS